VNLSIITINFNNADGLKKTIESVVSQTLDKYEYIIIDGGSSDESVEILENYSDKISNWISERDNGIYHAMNKGILKSHGDYCFFLNSGDYFVDDMVLEKVYNNLHHEDVIFGNLQVCLKGKIVGKSVGKEKLSFLDIYSGVIKHQSSFIKRQLFYLYGLYNEDLKILSDWEFFIKTIGLGGATYRYINLDISYFDNNGISNNSGYIVAEERKTIIETYLPKMMRPDYEFLIKYSRYEIVTKYKITLFLLRLMAKVIKIYHQFQ
jgi:glycosyltransferase involved in cell wall biosynthesis